jgi:hypothetical protein
MHNLVTDTLLMIRPVNFGRNEETAVNNYYQKTLDASEEEIQQKARQEFDAFVDKLRSEGVTVEVVEDTPEPFKPDSIFPNNWVSFHDNGDVWLYPMYAPSRRVERRDDILDSLKGKYKINDIHSLADWEQKEKFLEGTGSMIFDRPNNIAYAAISERTDEEVLDDFEERSGMEVVRFHAYQTVGNERKPIYHTNVMMFVGERVAVVCLDSIDDSMERRYVVQKLESSEKEIVEITEAQTEQFAGNMLQVASQNGERKIVMSKAAYESLTNHQIERLSQHGKLVYSDLQTIETLGGGSARCMMAEVFLPKN